MATANGYVEGTSGVDIEFSMNAGSFFNEATVNLDKPHRNNFAAILGMPTWDVGVTATARSTFQANGARGAMPLLFNAEAFPGAVCNEEAGPCTPQVYQLPGTGSEDVPQDATQFNWTIFCTASGNPCNANSRRCRCAHQRRKAPIRVIYLDDDIGPLNAGAHTTLFDELFDNAIGDLFPVPVVDDDGADGRLGILQASLGRGQQRQGDHGLLRLAGQRRGARRQRRATRAASLFTGAYSVRLTN